MRKVLSLQLMILFILSVNVFTQERNKDFIDKDPYKKYYALKIVQAVLIMQVILVYFLKIAVNFIQEGLLKALQENFRSTALNIISIELISLLEFRVMLFKVDLQQMKNGKPLGGYHFRDSARIAFSDDPDSWNPIWAGRLKMQNGNRLIFLIRIVIVFLMIVITLLGF